jgi:hypothetical protein
MGVLTKPNMAIGFRNAGTKASSRFQPIFEVTIGAIATLVVEIGVIADFNFGKDRFRGRSEGVLCS